MTNACQGPLISNSAGKAANSRPVLDTHVKMALGRTTVTLALLIL